MTLKVLTDRQVKRMRASVSMDTWLRESSWLEGVNYLGYWPTGDSVLLGHGSHVVCISREALVELAFEATVIESRLP